MTTLAPNDFTHLHVHSEFSLLDGLGRIGDLVDEAERLGFDSLALTDHGALYGAVAFYQAARAKGIKPIIGVETYVARRSMQDKEGKADSQPFHLVLLAKDLVGYRNLTRLLTDAHLEGYYYKPRIDREHLARHAEGLVGLSACLGGEIPKSLEVDDWQQARRLAGEYGDIFGKGNFFLELQDHGIPEQARLNEQLLRLAPEAGLPLVVTNDLHYVHKVQSEAHDVLLCVGTGSNLDTPNRLKFEGAEYYLKSAAEMAALFPDQRDALLVTRRIAEMVDLELPLGQLRIPHFPVPEGQTVESWLRAECERGLARRYGVVTPELQARLDYELGVIIQMGYAGYFLIVADFVRFAREQGIQTSCRGSAPGSIVTYTLGITPVDPIHYQLPFERFLNPDRVTMPDIDVDFEDGRRDEVINYVTRKYGADHVAQIITFGTMLARAAIRDVGESWAAPTATSTGSPRRFPTSWGSGSTRRFASPQLKELYTGDPSVRRIIDFAKQLEGVARNASTHAAGVVISREPLTELMPLQRATNSDAAMTQYEMHAIEALGLLKFDFLGLYDLTILRAAVDLIREQRGAEIDAWTRSPSTTRRHLELLASARRPASCAGVRGHAALHPRAAPDLGLRPGRHGGPLPARPMDNIPAYIRRKHGQEKVTYLHPLPRALPGEDARIFVYQEVMAAATALGGFSGPEADTLGYAIRKKKSSVLRSMKDKFVTQAAERGVRPETIDAVFKAFEPFERYGFNKAHATTYGLVAYPDRVPQGQLHRGVHGQRADGLPGQRREGGRRRRRMPPPGHPVLARRPREPSEFTVEGAAIRFGLLAVKNIGQGAIESIIAARESGAFRSFADFCNRIDLRLVNKRVLESLVKVGRSTGSGTRPSSSWPSTTSSPPRRPTSASGRRARSVSSTWRPSRPPWRRPSDRDEVPVRERLRWERSSSASTCRTIRWARSQKQTGGSSPLLRRA